MPNPVHRPQYAIFREMLIRTRLSSGLSQVKVAERLGKPQSYVSKVERGERRLDMTEFVEFADALGIDITTFIAKYRSRL